MRLIIDKPSSYKNELTGNLLKYFLQTQGSIYRCFKKHFTGTYNAHYEVYTFYCTTRFGVGCGADSQTEEDAKNTLAEKLCDVAKEQGWVIKINNQFTNEGNDKKVTGVTLDIYLNDNKSVDINRLLETRILPILRRLHMDGKTALVEQVLTELYTLTGFYFYKYQPDFNKDNAKMIQCLYLPYYIPFHKLNTTRIAKIENAIDIVYQTHRHELN